MKSIKDIPFDKLYVGMKVKYNNIESKQEIGVIDYLGCSKVTGWPKNWVVIKWDSGSITFDNHETMLRCVYYSEI